MASRDIQLCVPMLQQAWAYASREYITRYPLSPRPFITCTHRSNEEQAELYAKGRTTKGPVVTQIRAGGKHNQMPAQAFDIAFKKSDGTLDWSNTNFRVFAAILKAKFPQVKWGGDWSRFKDAPHFEV
jgi:peptidoglycan L-alanyl-D-glutamate endopeptidase CwlK